MLCIPINKGKLVFSVLAAVTCIISAGCRYSPGNGRVNGFHQDSIRVQRLLSIGDSLYARRSNMANIAESLPYFDSAYRMANRLGDTLLLANTLYFTGNVYNAWNREPLTTIRYYQQALDLYKSLPQKKMKFFYVRYILAHAYDGEKANDSTSCVQTLQLALADLQKEPDTLQQKMSFLSDFAWVASNVKAWPLATAFLEMIPRSSIKNDPKTNNYLDHYYLTRARMDVWGDGLKTTPYLDSLGKALTGCNNRFDSAYYAKNLSLLYQNTGQTAKALLYSRINETSNGQLVETDVLSLLRQELLARNVQTEHEKQHRIYEELKAKYTLFVSVVVVAVLLVLLYFAYQKRELEKARRRRQEEFTWLLLQKEEDERRRLAADLHDGINHELLALKNNLLLQRPVKADDVEDIISAVREVSRNLFPAMFETVGLQASLQGLCERFTQAGFFTTCDLEYKPLFNKNEELQLYRIVQEALNNVAKHAKADAAIVTITSNFNRFMLEIKDNGQGFDVEKEEAAGASFGLQSLRQRAAVINGSLSITSNGTGTIIKLMKQL